MSPLEETALLGAQIIESIGMVLDGRMVIVHTSRRSVAIAKITGLRKNFEVSIAEQFA